MELDLDAMIELGRAVRWLVAGFVCGALTYPFGAGWWTDGRE